MAQKSARTKAKRTLAQRVQETKNIMPLARLYQDIKIRAASVSVFNWDADVNMYSATVLGDIDKAKKIILARLAAAEEAGATKPLNKEAYANASKAYDREFWRIKKSRKRQAMSDMPRHFIGSRRGIAYYSSDPSASIPHDEEIKVETVKPTRKRRATGTRKPRPKPKPHVKRI